MPANITNMLVAGTWYVSGKSRAIVSAGPSPGSTPTKVPTKHPTKPHINVVGCKAVEKPPSSASKEDIPHL
jgi:hypothetical protein